MYRRILVGYKDTEQGHDALELGRILAQATRAEMFIATAPAHEAGGLAQLARSEGADLIVLGSTHRGSIGRVLPGATVDRLLGEAPCAVAIAPRITAHPGALQSQQPGTPSNAETLRDQLHDAVAELPAEARALPVFLRGSPSIELLAAAEDGIDMMILGSRGGGPMRRALHGSVSGTVIQEAHCPVLISPAGVKAPTAALV